MKVIEISRLELKDKYIKASHIGCVVKKYFNKSFKVYDDFDVVVSRMYWSREERQQYENALDKLDKNRQERFNGGKIFEETITHKLKELYAHCEVINWNDRGTTLFDTELKLCAVPDIVIKSPEINLIIECKGSKSTTPNYDNYLYQLALQDMLLQLPDCVCSLYFKDKEVNIDTKELRQKQNEIIESVKLLWDDVENNRLNIISVEEAIKRKEKKLEKIEYIETDEEIIDLINEVVEWNNKKDRIEEIKEMLYNKYINYTNIITEDGVKLSIVKENVAKIDKAYLLTQISKKEEDYKKSILQLQNELASIENNEPKTKVIKSGYIKLIDN
jgi:hypothetical protein